MNPIRHLIHKSLFAILISVIPISTKGQHLDITHHSTLGDEVASACTDQSGHLWLATNHGLTRWGDYLHGWSTWPLRPSPLRQRLGSVVCAPDGQLWIHTLRNEYLIYNPRTNELTDSIYQQMLEKGMEIPYNYKIKMDRDRIWVWAENKVYCLDGRGEKHLFPKISVEFEVKNIVTGKQWLYILGNNVIKKIDRRNGKTVSTVKASNSIDTYFGQSIEDQNGCIWVLAEELWKFNWKKEKWEMVDKGPFYGSLLCLSDGNIAVSSTLDGVHFYTHTGQSLSTLNHKAYTEDALLSDRIKSIYQGDDSRLWIFYDKEDASVCNLDGLPTISVNHIVSLKQGGKNDDIRALLSTKQGTLWIGTDGNGLYMQAEAGGEITKFTTISELNDAAITSLLEDSKGNLWIGTYIQGVYRYGTDGTVTHFLDNSFILDLKEDNRGSIYAAGSKGLYLKEEETQTFKHIDKILNWVTEVAPTHSHLVYVATVEGIGILNTSTTDFHLINSPKCSGNAISDERVEGLSLGQDGLVWVICSPGRNQLNMIDTENDTVYKFPELDHLNIQSIIKDGDGGIWALSEKTFVNVKTAYSPQQGCYTHSFHYYDPHLSDKHLTFNHQIAEMLNDGTIVQGTVNGMVRFSPSALSQKQRMAGNHPKIAFLKINNQMVATGDTLHGRVLLNEDIGCTDKIQLKYQENNLIFGILRSIEPTSDETRFCYRLKGLSDTWIGISNDEVTLQNLQPGDYLLEIGSEQLDGTIEPLDCKLDITISPPFWASSWAYLIYSLLITGIIVTLYQYFHGRKKRRETIKRLRQESERQQQLNNMKLNFFTNVSHDFRTPLSLIISPVEEMMVTEKNTKKQYTLGIIHRNALRLQSLVNQILDLRKIDAGGNVLTLTDGDILALAKDVCDDFALLSKNKGIKLSCTSDRNHIRMRFDSDKMRKVLVNLLSNAFKYTEEGGRVEIQLTDSNEKVVINVSDTGCGIPDESKDSVFDMFYQINSTHGGGGGSGIGLHIVKSLVELHHGNVVVIDNHPKGCQFIIELPKQSTLSSPEPVTASEEQEQNEPESVPAIKDADKQKTILVVEDNTDLLSFLQESLSTDYQVQTVTDGRKALEYLKHNDVDLIVSDIMMDGMDGLSLCKAVRSDVSISHLPIILLTAKSLPADELKGLELGADDYVTKPFHMPVLRLRIRNALDRAKSSHEQFARNIEIQVSDITISTVDEQFLNKAISIVEENINNPDYSVEMLSAGMCMHRTNLYKKILAITGKTPINLYEPFVSNGLTNTSHKGR